MNLAQYQMSQPPIQGTDDLGNAIDDGSYQNRGRRTEYMTAVTAAKLIGMLSDVGIVADMLVTPEDAVNFHPAQGETRKRWSYTIPEGTFPLGGLFATIYENDIHAAGKLYKRTAPDQSGNWIGFIPDAAPVQPPAPPNSSNTLFNAPFVGDAGAFTGQDRALLYRIAAALGVH